MGYTHYWTFSVPKGVSRRKLDKAYKAALVECAKVAIAYNKACTLIGKPEARLSGYTVHTKPGEYGGLKINGKGLAAHEDFTMREHYSQVTSFNFCKTAQKSYDIVVVACLSILKDALQDAIDVSSDGHAEDWANGVRLASKVLKRQIENPIKSRTEKVVSNIVVFKTR